MNRIASTSHNLLSKYETTNEKQLTVEEYVCYIRIKENIQRVLESTNIREIMHDAEESINGLTIDLTIKYCVNRKEH